MVETEASDSDDERVAEYCESGQRVPHGHRLSLLRVAYGT
jgi:hypothetical protein